MYVKKFIGETLDETLKTIKKEFGPEAIILKTVTPKGAKALSKGKIEITAAIDEDEYSKKNKVDSILTPEQKEKFYQSPAKQINETIQQYHQHNKAKSLITQGNLNKSSNLDEFLEKSENVNHPRQVFQNFQNEEIVKSDQKIEFEKFDDSYINEKIELLENKIQLLEKKIHQEKSPYSFSINRIIKLLRGISIDEEFIQKTVRKCVFELNDQEIEDFDLIYDLTLREFNHHIHTSTPLILNSNTSSNSITILLSETSCGQTSVLFKLASAMPETILISGPGQNDKNAYKPLRYLMGKELHQINEIHEIVSFCEKNKNEGQPIIIDLKHNGQKNYEIKKCIDLLKKNFSNIEVLITISAIHSDDYNRKIMNLFKNMANGIILTHLDLCSHYSHLFNLHFQFPDLNIKSFSTGPQIPTDFEKASQERLLSKIFHL